MNWKKLWLNDTNFKSRFKILDSYLKDKPNLILDIGCGFAYVPGFFQEKYGTKLWLLDGNPNNNSRQIEYGPVNDFDFYYNTDEIKEQLNSRNLNYTFVDAANIDIDESIKFDLITSFASCGAHYPAETYKDLILKHSHKDTKIVLDIRKKTNQNINIVNVIEKTRKSDMCEIKFR